MRPLPVLAGLLVLPSLAVATSLIPHTLLQRAEQSDRVVLVQVLSQRVEETKGAEFPLKTLTRVVVGQDLRGSGPAELTIVQLGGSLGLQTMEIPGDAKFHMGETAVVFLRCRLAVDRCHLVPWARASSRSRAKTSSCRTCSPESGRAAPSHRSSPSSHRPLFRSCR